MVFYDGNAISRWRDQILIGGLTAQGIIRLRTDGRKIVEEERIPLGARIRDVEVGPDGAIYALTDENNGKILRLSPAD
jgi:glucose/arabinose dehydrogenase